MVTAAFVCSAVWASAQSCDTSLETGLKAVKSHGQKVTLPPLPERKIPGGWGPAGTCTARNTRESAWGCQLIFTLREKKISCHLTLHIEHLQTNATSAGYLPSAASALPHALSVSFSRSATSVKRPLGNPHISWHLWEHLENGHVIQGPSLQLQIRLIHPSLQQLQNQK